MTTIGCLALQGCVERHRPHIEAAGATFLPVKTKKDFDKVDAFILPGGESTTMLRLIKVFDLWDVLAQQFKDKPVWGICAGTILMAKKVWVNDNFSSLEDDQKLDEKDEQKSFNLLPMTVLRNGYGTQVTGSQIINLNGYDVSFIRAPIIHDIETDTVDVRAEYDDKPVWIQGKGDRSHYIASTFHPELTFNFPSPMHQHFIKLVNEKR